MRQHIRRMGDNKKCKEYSVKVTLPDGQVMAVTASESDTLEAVADRFKDYYEDDIILGIVNGRLRELNKKIKSRL